MSMRVARTTAALSAIIYTLAPIACEATETVTHQYDELGRLKQTTKSGGPANGAQTTTTYDPAGNRTNQTTTAPPPSPPPPP